MLTGKQRVHVLLLKHFLTEVKLPVLLLCRLAGCAAVSPWA